MKKTLTLITLFLALIQVHAQSPDKICFDYDAGGNRIAQKPAVLVWDQASQSHIYSPDCTPSVFNGSGKFGVNIIKISHIGLLEELYPWLTDIRWVMPLGDVPIKAWEGVSVYTPASDFVIANPHLPYAIVYDDLILPPAAPPMQQAPPQPLEVSLVPNPTDGRFTVVQSGFDPDKSEIYIVNMQGAVLFKREFVNGEINISEYSGGEYLLILQDDKNSKTVRFVKK
jgi:hypothetical protein